MKPNRQYFPCHNLHYMVIYNHLKMTYYVVFCYLCMRYWFWPADAFCAVMWCCITRLLCVCIGAVETVNKLKTDYGLKIGSSTGFIRSMVDILLEESAKAGYIPDSSVASDEVPQVSSVDFHSICLKMIVYKTDIYKHIHVWPNVQNPSTCAHNDKAQRRFINKLTKHQWYTKEVCFCWDCFLRHVRRTLVLGWPWSSCDSP